MMFEKPLQTFDCRVSFAQTLIEIAREDERIVAVCNDSVGSSNLVQFAREFPQRLINVGIAEQNMIGVGAGLANAGYVPFVCGASPFLTGRGLEQIKVDVAYSGTPVILCGMSPGLAYGELGPTHHSIEDLAWLRAIADLTVVVPADPSETAQVVKWAATVGKPTFLRISRHKVPAVSGTDREFTSTKAHVITDGNDVSIIAMGTMVHVAVDAAQILKDQGIGARVIHVTTLKPLDNETIIKAARETKAIVTVEEATTIGGLGGAIAELLSETVPTKMKRVGIPGVFAPTGSVDFLFDHFGMTPKSVAREAMELLGKSVKEF